MKSTRRGGGAPRANRGGGAPNERRAGGKRRGRGAALTGALAAVAARAAYAALNRYPPGGGATWNRTNHRGDQVTLLEGPAFVAGAVTATAFGPGLAGRTRAAAALAVLGSGALGGYDDIAGTGDRRGFRGHLGALRRGEVTTGAVKILGIGTTGLAAGAVMSDSPVDAVINGGLVAGGANLLNLFDLRPGRAVKVGLLAGSLLAAGSSRHVTAPRGTGRRSDGMATPPLAVIAAPLGAAGALLPEDLRERAMLGDAGANALGALLGIAAASSLSRPARLALLAGVAGLTAASEVVSFTKVIEKTPPLRWLDMLGRRPAPPAPAAPSNTPASGPVPPSPPATVPAPGHAFAPTPGGGDPATA